MMRDILFRGKRKGNGEWIEGYYCGKVNKAIFSPAEDSAQIIDDDLYWHEVIPETVGQYTGFKDINNEKIFEGDILFEYKTTEINGKKCYEPVRKFAVELSDDYVTIIEGKDMGYDYVVIGDIYTNPDFLGGADNV